MAIRAENHRAEQAALATIIARLIAQAWARLLDPHDLKNSSPRLTVAAEAIVRQYGQASAAHALTSYRLQRREAGIPGRPAVKMPPLPPRDLIVGTIEKALHPLYGPVTPELEQSVQDEVAAAVEQLVLDQGRQAVIDAVQADKEAKGWARVPEPDACSFCALLATRGAVYKTRETASFEAHNNCRCNAEPVFNSYEPSAQIRQWQAEYRDLTKRFGKSGRDIHVAWRQHHEGRPVTGPLVKPYKRSR